MVQMVRTGRGMVIVEIAPTHCPHGHRLAPPNVQVFFGVRPGLPISLAGGRGLEDG
jgi:hypothetical protein